MKSVADFDILLNIIKYILQAQIKFFIEVYSAEPLNLFSFNIFSNKIKTSKELHNSFENFSVICQTATKVGHFSAKILT